MKNKYILTVRGKKFFEAETMWECIEYGDFYFPEGYSIREFN